MTQDLTCELQAKRCVPCEGGVPRIAVEEAGTLLSAVPGWAIVREPDRLRKEWRFKNFREAMAFVNATAEIAEAEGHHHDVHVTRYRFVAIEIWTHAIGGLSENDFILAAKIDAVCPSEGVTTIPAVASVVG